MSQATEAPPVELETGATPTASIIWLHGLGADGHDFVPIVPELELPPKPPVRFVFPHAPYRPVTVNGGFVMRAWYDIVAIDHIAQQDAAGIRASEKILQGLIQRELERGIVAKRIVLAGFSQGGVVVLHTGIRFPQRLGGILALSTHLPLHEAVSTERQPANADVPIFMAHGTEDPIVPLPLGQASYKLMKTLGFPITWHTYPMGHSVSPQEIADIGNWLREILG
jgi:phospholipase/carboxylesterase